MYFQPKQIQLESLKHQWSPWLIICTSFNELPHHIIQMAINHIEIILCASKLHVFNIVVVQLCLALGTSTSGTLKSLDYHRS